MSVRARRFIPTRKSVCGGCDEGAGKVLTGRGNRSKRVQETTCYLLMLLTEFESLGPQV